MTTHTVRAVHTHAAYSTTRRGRVIALALLGFLTVAREAGAQEEGILKGHFDAGEDGFAYVDDAFRGTTQPVYPTGTWTPCRGYEGGALEVQLGGLDTSTIAGMSGAWCRDFTFNRAGTATLIFDHKLTQTPPYEPDEESPVLVSLDGTLVAEGTNDHVAQIAGDGDGGLALTADWKMFKADLGTLGPGTHTLVIGSFNSQKSDPGEVTQVLIDNVVLVGEAVTDPRGGGQGGGNPHWHQPSDLYAAYSDADFRLGFNALQMTLGAIAELAGATIPLIAP